MPLPCWPCPHQWATLANAPLHKDQTYQAMTIGVDVRHGRKHVRHASAKREEGERRGVVAKTVQAEQAKDQTRHQMTPHVDPLVRIEERACVRLEARVFLRMSPNVLLDRQIKRKTGRMPDAQCHQGVCGHTPAGAPAGRNALSFGAES